MMLVNIQMAVTHTKSHVCKEVECVYTCIDPGFSPFYGKCAAFELYVDTVCNLFSLNLFPLLSFFLKLKMEHH